MWVMNTEELQRLIDKGKAVTNEPEESAKYNLWKTQALTFVQKNYYVLRKMWQSNKGRG